MIWPLLGQYWAIFYYFICTHWYLPVCERDRQSMVTFPFPIDSVPNATYANTPKPTYN